MFAPETFDLIIFNPPYLPHDDYTDLTTDGGNNGLEITNTWIQLSLTLIKKSGKILFLQSTLTPIHEYLDFLSKSTKVNIISKKKLFFEELYIIEVMHNE
jgi:methylase of polypeptide subunit release factors